ncbi:SUF system NifU family Fe-S cluster assembly protein [Aquihabitans sp. G128]|uniref:Fe-S cluster assembly sulfur transfer protein SufU n=1 Tax=Aquihabitans sp. G128 TaxID=2849779 RepID=UPI001C22F1AF|nr:SUF system NifU family Fe-S cluster assembly protein [Aquihabitans sp. G128]QXC61287.1 SUF system NifU family Fe-S cluster assembly protein [Aquihabitans sp. G128]
MPGLEDLYREIILDHYRSPRNRGELETPPATRTEGFNPLCGDEIVVYLDVDASGTVGDIRIGGTGCSISQSSASMMSAAVKGKTLAEVRALTRAFKGMMSLHESSLDTDGESGEELDADGEPVEDVKLGDLGALRGVVKFPVRIKCATLAWNTLMQGVDEAAEAHPA